MVMLHVSCNVDLPIYHILPVNVVDRGAYNDPMQLA